MILHPPPNLFEVLKKLQFGMLEMRLDNVNTSSKHFNHLATYTSTYWITEIRRVLAIIIIHTRLCCRLRCSNNSLCKQDTTSRNAESQWRFNSHFAFLGLNKFANFTAKVIFHLRFSLFCRCFCSGEIDFPTLVGRPISKTNSFATGVKLFPWKCLKTGSALANMEI